MDVGCLEEQARLASSVDMRRLIENTTELLSTERATGRQGTQRRRGGLIELPRKGKAIVVGDIHGDLDSLKQIFSLSGFLAQVSSVPDAFIVFLGDYGDRGENSLQVYWILLKLKTLFPAHVVLLRGNHEPPPGLGVYPFDLPRFLWAKYGLRGQALLPLFMQLFDALPHAAVVPGSYLMLHGGLPEDIQSIEDIETAREKHPLSSCLEQILWSDPGANEETRPSMRGAGRLFGKEVSRKILALLGARILIRAHEPCEGIMIHHEGRVLTLFSRKGPPYHNHRAAYLMLDLAEHIATGYELRSRACFF